jgi:hypothetical protein
MQELKTACKSRNNQLENEYFYLFWKIVIVGNDYVTAGWPGKQ